MVYLFRQDYTQTWFTNDYTGLNTEPKCNPV